MEGGIDVGGKDEGSTSKELVIVMDEGNVGGMVRLEEGRDVGEKGVEKIVGIDFGIIVSFVEGCGREEGGGVELGFVIEDSGRVTDEEIPGKMEDTELGPIDEDGATEGDIKDDTLNSDTEIVGLEMED